MHLYKYGFVRKKKLLKTIISFRDLERMSDLLQFHANARLDFNMVF